MQKAMAGTQGGQTFGGRAMLAMLLHAALWNIGARAADLVAGLTPSLAPTKGHMQGIVGDTWTLEVDVSDAEHLGFLPAGEQIGEARAEELKSETIASFEYMKDFARYRGAMLAGGYYTSGKGFQKVGMLCLLLERFLGVEDNRTQECVDWLSNGFKCFYDPSAAAGTCQGASASYYDEDWGGIASRQGWDDKECNSDYGNTCYNDHHYHFGYFVVSAAILAKLKPACLQDELFVDYVNTMIRDTANPSYQDGHFPRFRTFDWFDLHSWSHGLAPMHDGKDQESTSEELNLLHGLQLWGRAIGNGGLEKLGATMLALAAHTVREFFLMKDGNPYHPPEFVRNRVTGIFLQGKVDYTTWFGAAPEHIHGIQMLPLSPALQLTRKPDFCRQEWRDVLGQVPRQDQAWTSILLTGGLAMIQPEQAYELLKGIDEGKMDNGLTRAWALYWAASKPGESLTPAAAPAEGGLPRGTSLLVQVGRGGPPDLVVFPPAGGHPVHRPAQTEVAGPKATNKFWANWVVDTGLEHPIFPMPYVLRWGGASDASPELHISHNVEQQGIPGRLGPGRMQAYVTPTVTEFTLSTQEPASRHIVTSEDLFGFNAEVRGHAGQVLGLPIYSGMAYVSGRFSGGFTPVVSHHHGLAKIEKVSDGIWTFVNRRGTEFRVYVLDAHGAFVDGSYRFDEHGRLSRTLEGWVRLAHVVEANDTQVLDAHARAIVVGCELEVEAGGIVRYAFRKEGASDIPLLHWGYGHHAQLLKAEPEPALDYSARKTGPLLL